MKLSSFEKSVLGVIRKIPRGRIATYKKIAQAAGGPQAARAVGNALGKNPDLPRVPCHRVVKSDGRIGGYSQGIRKKIKLLNKEGIGVKKGKIANFKEVLHKFNND